jgi:hypothetical protein
VSLKIKIKMHPLCHRKIPGLWKLNNLHAKLRYQMMLKMVVKGWIMMWGLQKV